MIGALQGDVEGRLLAAAHRQHDLGIDRPAHLVDGVGERQAHDRLVVDLDDQIARLDAGLGRGRAVDGRDDLDHAVLHRDLDAEAAELALGLHLHVIPFLGIHVAGMRVEGGQHAVDRRLDQLLVRDRLDIGGADLLEHVAEQVELLIGVVVCVIARLPDGSRQRYESNGDHAGHQPGSKLHCFSFHVGVALAEPGCRIDRVPVATQLDIELRLAVLR